MPVHRKVMCLMLMLVSAGCRPSAQQAVFSATLPAASVAVTRGGAMTLVPTINLLPTRTPTPSKTPVPLDTNTPPPTNTLEATTARTAVPIHTPTPDGTATDPSGTPRPTWTPPPADPATELDDHYHLRRPIADGLVNYVDRTYPYGGTQGGTLQVHHGVEFNNGRGTPVLAAADGTVHHAGDDLTTVYGASAAYYGRLVVIQHDFQSPQGEPVYTLYGHLASWDVETGARVSAGQQIGVVGDTGIAQGPHLHFEVRVGSPTDFGATRNPELWIFPFRGFGTLVGRVTDSQGNVLREAPVQVRSVNLARYAFTYGDDTVNSDAAFGENFTLGDLPANYYEVSVTADGRVRFRQTIYVYPNRSTWIDVQLNN